MDHFENYFTLAIRLLARRSRSKKELIDYLRKKKAPEEVIASVLSKLEEKKFQSDEDFTRWWVEQRIRFRSKSDRAITAELLQKGIEKDLIKKILNEFNDSGQTDLAKAKKVVEKKIKKYQSLSKEQQYHKLGFMLARMGYSWETIRQAIDAYYQRDYNTE
ncbi:MAG: regulatory protein RecX [Candidatus Levybacteria bacterium]|nr:regulatory protein RecX [Candidatus Levybacteria bacterium]